MSGSTIGAFPKVKIKNKLTQNKLIKRSPVFRWNQYLSKYKTKKQTQTFTLGGDTV